MTYLWFLEPIPYVAHRALSTKDENKLGEWLIKSIRDLTLTSPNYHVQKAQILVAPVPLGVLELDSEGEYTQAKFRFSPLNLNNISQLFFCD